MLDFIIELVEGTPLTCAARSPINFIAYHGKTKRASFDIGGVSAICTVSFETMGLLGGAIVWTNASPIDFLPAVWEYTYTVPFNAPIGVSQTTLQWNRFGIQCCKIAWMLVSLGRWLSVLHSFIHLTLPLLIYSPNCDCQCGFC